MEDELKDAIEMLGTGYDQPTVVIEPPRTITVRHEGRMVEVEEPAWVKFSTDFKKELKSLDEHSLKVFLYIGLSVNWKTGKSFPGIRKIAEDTGMAPNTVTKAVENLEMMNYMTVSRREGTSNIYKPLRFISIGTVAPDATLPSQETSELSQKNGELSQDGRVNLHNKNNKNEQEISKKPDLFDAELEQARKASVITNCQNEFESAIGFTSLPWSSNNTWASFSNWVVKITGENPLVWRQYAMWKKSNGKYDAMSNKQIRMNPRAFIDTGYPTFMASYSMYGTDGKGGGKPKQRTDPERDEKGFIISW